MSEGQILDGLNMPGSVYILKFYADLQKHNVKHYENKVKDLIKKAPYSDKESAIRKVLTSTNEGILYMALKHSVTPSQFSEASEKLYKEALQKEISNLSKKLNPKDK
jgi:hypothetical protein